MPDPAVRSIQIASTLVTRLAELIRPRRSAEVIQRLAGEVAADQLELRLGEAQQIAPEIWRHLDDAHRAMAERGVQVAGYAELRALPNPALLATSNIEVKRKLDVLGLVQGDLRVVVTKDVTWDPNIILGAIAAIAMLEASLPDVDWDALDRADREQIEAVGSLRSARWKAAAKWLAVAAAVTAISIGIHAAFTRHDPEAEAAAVRATQATEQRARAREDHRARIAELTAKHTANPCDQATAGALAAYLMADGQPEAAHAVERAVAACPAP